MAHGGEEGALRLAGRLGRILGLFQLRRAHAHLALELVAVIGQGAVAAVDLRQHVVETVDQHAQLVAALVRDAVAVGLAARHFLRCINQLGDRLGNHALEAPRQEDGDQEGQHGGAADGAHVAADVAPHVVQVCLDQHGADDLLRLAGPVDGTVQTHGGRQGRARALRDGLHGHVGQQGRVHVFRCCQAIRMLRRAVQGEQAPAPVEQGRLGHLVARGQRGQHLFRLRLCRFAHQQGHRAGRTDHARQRQQLLAFIVLVVEHGRQRKRHEHQQQRAA